MVHNTSILLLEMHILNHQAKSICYGVMLYQDGILSLFTEHCYLLMDQPYSFWNSVMILKNQLLEPFRRKNGLIKAYIKEMKKATFSNWFLNSKYLQPVVSKEHSLMKVIKTLKITPIYIILEKVLEITKD